MMARWLRASVFLLAVGFATTALADGLPIKGSYGNKDGCAYAKSGESTGSDDFFLLKGDAVTTAASACTFGKLVSSSKGKFVVNVTCEDEGESAADVMTVTPSGKDAYTITMDDGTNWGPLKQCR